MHGLSAVPCLAILWLILMAISSVPSEAFKMKLLHMYSSMVLAFGFLTPLTDLLLV